MNDTLLTRHRPTTFEEVIGHATQVKALQRAIKERSTHSYLLTGPSGVGKTTLARLTAAALGCKVPQEVDAATNTGVDDMRAITATLPYKPLDGASKAIIIDECHAISKQAWQSLLKSLEEPPAHVYWMLCTTEPTRVPESIKTRCIRIDLKPVATTVIRELLGDVCKRDKLDVAADVLDLCAKEAHGSPRQGLANLGACLEAKGVKGASKMLAAVVQEAEAVELARLLMNGADWSEVTELLGRLKDANPEGVRHVVRAYMTKVILNPRSNDQVEPAFAVLEEFSKPFPSSDGLSPLVLACGRLLLGE
jgi:DNA polymerase-3 subunit gamma/tau